MLEYIKKYFVEIDKKKRREKLLKKHGDITLCPKCGDVHQEQKNNTEALEDGVYKYSCTKCGNVCVFNYIVAPMPICVQENVVEETLRQQSQNYHKILMRLIGISDEAVRKQINESYVIEELKNEARKAMKRHAQL